MDLKSFIGVAGIPLIQALVALIKTMFPDFPARYYPGLAVFFGIALNVGLAYLLQADYGLSVVIGLIAGLGAAKLFEYGKEKETATAIEVPIESSGLLDALTGLTLTVEKKVIEPKVES